MVAVLAVTAGLNGCSSHARSQATSNTAVVSKVSPPSLLPPEPTKSQAPGAVTEVTEANFYREVLDSPLPTFIEFYASWCQPCQEQAPLIERAAREYAGRLKFIRIDIDKNHDLAKMMGLRMVPTMIVVKADKQTVRVAESFLDAGSLKQFIEDGLNARPKP